MLKKGLLSVALFLGFLCLSSSLFAQSQHFRLGKSLDIQLNVLRELSVLYVDTLDLDKILLSSTESMLQSLDPYTVLIREEDNENLEMMTTGSYGGVGAMIRKDSTGGVLITEIYENSPAHKYGLSAGDVILYIDTTCVKNLKIDECSSMMKGVAGSKVKFRVKRFRTEQIEDIILTRERIHFPDVVYSGFVNDTTGYIRITGFTVGGSSDVRKALLKLKESDNLKKLVIDLRGNGGGILDEAVGIVSLFVPRGTTVVSSLGKYKPADIVYKTKEEPVDLDLPITVLVNSGSASASEIVAGALQDLDRATIVGTRTFGKGLVQSIRDVGYNHKIKLTTAKYYIPSGRCIQAIDYSHKNEDGSVASVPDSLMKEFKTVGGRTVYDGGGIMPDIVVDQKIYSRPVVSLIYSDILNDYSMLYYKENLSISAPREFSLTDQEYDMFVTWALDKDFDYRSTSEIELSRFKAIAQREGTYAQLKDYIDSIESGVKNSKEIVFQKYKNEIKSLLEEEIVNRYYFQRGRVEKMILSDNQLLKAIEV